MTGNRTRTYSSWKLLFCMELNPQVCARRSRRGTCTVLPQHMRTGTPRLASVLLEATRDQGLRPLSSPLELPRPGENGETPR